MPTPGVFIRQLKSGLWTKKVVDLRDYCATPHPKWLRFRSPMVNDYNQYLCCGGQTHGIRNTEENTVLRVVNGKKPLAGSIMFDSELQTHQAAKKLRSLGLLVSVHRTGARSGDGLFDEPRLTVSVPGKLGDIFDMDALASDYHFWLGHYAAAVISNAKKLDMEEFHHGFFDVEDHDESLVGLVLGYPIENTMSLSYPRPPSRAELRELPKVK